MRPIPKSLKPRFSTRFRLVALVICIVLPLAALLLNAADEARRSAQDKLRLQLRLFSTIVAGELEQSVSAMKQLLAAVAQIPEVQRHEIPECSRILGALQRQFPVYSNLYTATASGDQRCSALPVESAINLADRDYFKVAMSSKEPSVGSVVRGRASGVMVLPVGVAIIGEGNSLGVVAASLDLGQFIRQIAPTQLTPHLVLTLWNMDGHVLAQYPDNDARAGKGLPDTPVFRAIREENMVKAPGPDGTSRYHAFVPLKSHGGGLWVSASMPVAEVDRELQQALWRNLGLLFVVGLAVCYLAWSMAERTFRKPLLQIEAAADAVRRGHYEVRSSVSRGVPELVSLSLLFDSMVDALQSSVQKHAKMEQELTAAMRALESKGAAPARDSQ